MHFYSTHFSRVTVLLMTLLMITNIFNNFTLISDSVIVEEEINPFTENKHITSAIWRYKNEVKIPTGPTLFKINKNQWEALSSVCIVPAFIGRTTNIPILISDKSEDSTINIPHETKAVESWGSDAITASANAVLNYWSRAELVFAVENIEQAYLVISSASFLEAPILVSPTLNTLNSLETKCVIAIGNTQVKADKILELPTKQDVWNFQLELFDTKGFICNYIIITNPYDTEDKLNNNIKWPYMSIASAPLAAYRKALVQTGDYTGDKAVLNELNRAQNRMDNEYNSLRPYFENVKQDSYEVERYLIDHDHKPEYIAIVGGAFAVPDYYFDIHTKYKYWDQVLHYVPSMSPYANLSSAYPSNISVKEDLGIGRIIGHSILDATALLMRTFHYRELLQGGKYSNIFSDGWENNAAVLDGHRLNQPRIGGPPNETSARPYYPSSDILETQSSGELNTEYYLPRNDSDPTDTNPTVDSILSTLEKTSMIQVLAHGGSMTNAKSIWLEGGYNPNNPEAGERKLTISSKQILTKNFPPSLYYFIACHTGHIFLEQDMEDYFPLAFLHSGAVSLIAPVTCQAICFWYKAPYGPASTQAQYFWENMLTENMVPSKALAKAK